MTIENAETVYSRYDFIPGDKVIFFDDFSDTDVGEFPRKWTLNGPKGGNNNAVEVVEYQGKRFLRSNPAAKGKSQFESTQFLRLNQKGDLPEKFTVEFDAVFANAIPGGYPNSYVLQLLNSKDGWLGNDASHNLGVIFLSGEENISRNTRTNVGKVDGRVHHVAVSVNGTFVKAYIDNVRVINDPDGAKRPITLIGLSMYSGGNLPSDKVMFTNFRLAEGGKNIKSALDTEGKIVTHGILFDTGKDIIKPESLPTLKSILAILNDSPGLNFSIEGHTDNQGNNAINQPLSEKRAAAVRTWLIDKGIAATRLKTKGFGDTKADRLQRYARRSSEQPPRRVRKVLRQIIRAGSAGASLLFGMTSSPIHIFGTAQPQCQARQYRGVNEEIRYINRHCVRFFIEWVCGNDTHQKPGITTRKYNRGQYHTT